MPNGPQTYPGANLSHWYEDNYAGDAMEANTIAWHSTETTVLPEYSGGSMAPTLTTVPDFTAKRLAWWQHFPFDVSARALVHAGAVATNTLNVAQVEIVGTCDPATHAKWAAKGIEHLYMPELPDWAIRDLAAFVLWAHDQQGVPLTSDVTWKAYPASYGTNNGVRLSDAAWLRFSGHCGHQHVPSGNVHGDPGLFPMAAILAKAKTPKPAVKPRVDLSNLVRAFEDYPHHPAVGSVKIVQAALAIEGLYSGVIDGAAGPRTRTAYKAWQHSKLGGGYTGSAADGIPGRDSLNRLGARNGFTITP